MEALASTAHQGASPPSWKAISTLARQQLAVHFVKQDVLARTQQPTVQHVTREVSQCLPTIVSLALLAQAGVYRAGQAGLVAVPSSIAPTAVLDPLQWDLRGWSAKQPHVA